MSQNCAREQGGWRYLLNECTQAPDLSEHAKSTCNCCHIVHAVADLTMCKALNLSPKAI